jgi:hypothetical protein
VASIARAYAVAVTISTSRFHRSHRRWLVFVVVAFVVVAFTMVEAKMTHGGMVYWYDQIPWVIRDAIRSAWSTVTGQPPTRDLFPF